MPKQQNKFYAIGLHRPAIRRLLKILLLVWPFCLMDEKNLLWDALLVAIVYWFVSKTLYVTANKLRFGLNKAYKVTNLTDVELASGGVIANQSLNLTFSTKEGKKTEAIKVSNLKAENRANLLRAIEQFAPQAKIASTARNILSGQMMLNSLSKFGDTCQLTYNTKPLVGQFLHILAGYQSYFWLAWNVIGTLIVLGNFSCQHFGLRDYKVGHNLLLDPIYSAILAPHAWLVSPIEQIYNVGFYSSVVYAGPIAEVFAIAAVLLIGAAVLPYLTRPNKLKIDSVGLSLELQIGSFTKTAGHINWSEVDQIKLIRAEQTTGSVSNLLKLTKKNGSSLLIDLRALGDASQRWTLAQAIEKYVPHVIIDPAAIATLRPPVEASFTDIWLAGLSKAPHSEALLPLAEGDQLRDGQYRIVDRYMLGGQSTVYLAARSGTECSSALEEASPTQDKAAAADLVIKEAILPVFNDKTKMAKCLIDFENQTKLLGDLSHPGLVRVVDSFVEGSRGFVVMERVRGSSLMSIVHEKGAMEPALVLDLARQMCDILGYLHSQSPAVIHRDFTPDNLLLDAAGKIKLVDFGVAQKDSEHVTATVVGKHAYMPPEQFRGRTGSASDLYAMGATLYFLLTGLEPTPLTKLKLDDQGTGAPLQVEARKRLAALVASLTEFDEKDRPGGALAVLTMLNTVYETPSVEDAHTIRLPNKESMLG